MVSFSEYRVHNSTLARQLKIFPSLANHRVCRSADKLALSDSLHRLRRFGSIQLGINLRHDRGRMPQDVSGYDQAEFPTEPSRRVVAELVRFQCGIRWLSLLSG